MTASTSIPAKFLVPWAQNDSSRVEIPVTTTDSTRASQSLGFPPLTMQPPESGGVPPQGEDFNGGLNQVARIAWWTLLGAGFPYDATFATSSYIGGYPQGALIPRTDLAGYWLNTSNNNTTNPDATDGTAVSWVPVAAYGTYTLSGQTGGTFPVYPLNAAFDSMVVSGALTSALTLQVPAWIKKWTVTNNTTGGFVLTVKTAAGTGIVIPQNGSPTEIVGDGTNILQPARNVAAATSRWHPLQLGQATGRLLNIQRLTGSGTYNPIDTATTFVVVEMVGGGGAGGGAPATTSTQIACSGGGASGKYLRKQLTSGFTAVSYSCGAGGTGVSGAGGTGGGATTFGALTTGTSAGGPSGAPTTSPAFVVVGGAGGGAAPTGGDLNIGGGGGGYGLLAGTAYVGGRGGSCIFGMGAGESIGNGPGASAAALGYGGGGGGCGLPPSSSAQPGGNAAPGLILVYEYA